MDFMDWQKENLERYGLDEEDMDVVTDAAVVAFEIDSRGYVSGMYRGRPVYRDSAHASEISPGDIWIVELSPNPKTGHNYFAKPLRKIDASFLYEMKKDQIDALAKRIWEENRVILEPYLEDIYRDVVAERIAASVKEQTEAVAKEMDALRSELEELRRISEQDKAIIESKDEEIAALTERAESLREPSQPKRSEPPEGFGDLEPPAEAVIRSGPDTIRSRAFKKSRYFVHLSADHKRLLVREDRNGKVVCIDGEMALYGLESLLPFTEERELPSERSGRYGGLIVHLE